MKMSYLFYNYFLKCTLFSPIFMQTANAFYASAQMLKFHNDFKIPLSLQRDPEGTYYFRLFYFSKILTLYMCFQQNTLCSSWFWEKIRFYYRFDILPLIFFKHNLNKHPEWNSWVYFKRKPRVCTRLVLTSSIFKCLITYPLCLYRGFLQNH